MQFGSASADGLATELFAPNRLPFFPFARPGPTTPKRFERASVVHHRRAQGGPPMRRIDRHAQRGGGPEITTNRPMACPSAS